MTYYINLFSPETYETFSKTDRTISGFRTRQRNVASKIKPGDKLVCYLTKLSRWIGVLEVESESFENSDPIFYGQNDPFVIRFKVKPVVWLPKEKAIPIRDSSVWDVLSFTKDIEKNSSVWTGKLRSSLNQLEDHDGQHLERLLIKQEHNDKTFQVDETEYSKYLRHKVRRPEG